MAYIRKNEIPGAIGKYHVSIIDESMTIRYFTVYTESEEIEKWAEHDVSSAWDSLTEFLESCEGFKEVSENELSRFLENKGDSCKKDWD